MDNSIMMKLDLPNVPISENVAKISLVAFLEQLELSFEEVSAVTTALSEAIKNCISHAYPNATGNIIVTYSLKGTELTVVVHDSGFGIANTSEALPPALSTVDRSGNGFTIMESSMDDVMVSSISARGTTVTMKKTFAAR